MNKLKEAVKNTVMNAANPFGKFAMTESDRERLKNMDYLVDGLVPKSNCIVFYGAAGAGKTSVLHYLAMKVAMERPEMLVTSIYLDGAGTMAADMDEHRISMGVDNYVIAYNGSSSEINQKLKDMQSIDDLSNHLIIYDTFKYLTENINCKASNKTALHDFIKPLTKKGATFIIAHHTNKDGDKFAGTAELEQDTDGMIKAVSFESDGKIKTSLIKGGRCRFNFKECSFEYIGGQPSSVVATDFLKPDENINVVYALKDYIGTETKTKKELTEFLIDQGIPRRKTGDLIYNYSGVFWRFHKGENKNEHRYSGMSR